MYITKIQATINVRETKGAIRNVHYKDTGNNKRKRNQRGNQECTLQRYRQHRAQDTKRRQTNKNITLKTINMRRTS
jgi:hypothetical protein